MDGRRCSVLSLPAAALCYICTAAPRGASPCAMTSARCWYCWLAGRRSNRSSVRMYSVRHWNPLTYTGVCQRLVVLFHCLFSSPQWVEDRGAPVGFCLRVTDTHLDPCFNENTKKVFLEVLLKVQCAVFGEDILIRRERGTDSKRHKQMLVFFTTK